MKNLYALVVGIDAYRDPVPTLNGCVGDATKISDWLEKNVDRTVFNLQKVVLLNEQATRQGIIDGFMNHLKKAQTGDTALFFFAGHGSREEAHPMFFKIEPDKKLETILCYDSRHDGVKDLTDKELRWLVRKVSGDNPDASPHIVVIQDNCHSGGGMRGEDTDYKQRMVDTEAAARKWEDYVFAREVDSSKAEKFIKENNQFLPQGRRVQLAACATDESAWETTYTLPDGSKEKGGIFTRRIVEVLNATKGKISYYDLITRAKTRVGGVGFSQTPEIDVFPYPNDVYGTFLTGEVAPLSGNAPVMFNSGLGWHIALGAFHNVQVGAPTPVSVKNTDTGKYYAAKVTEVQPGLSKIQFEGEAPNQDDLLEGKITNLFRVQPRVFFDETAAGVLAKIKTGHDESAKNFLASVLPVTDESQAQYSVHTIDKQFVITMPFDKERPRVKPLAGTGEGSLAMMLPYLDHISKWETTKNLFNRTTGIQPIPGVLCQFVLHKNDGKVEEIPLKGAVIELDPAEAKMEIKLKNLSPDRPLFASALFLDADFKVQIDGLQNFVQELQPAEEAYLTFGTSDTVFDYSTTIPPFITDFNWEYYEFFLKVLVSTHDFSPVPIQLPPLPMPAKMDMGDVADDRSTRVAPKPASMRDWTAYNVKIKIKNPYFSV